MDPQRRQRLEQFLRKLGLVDYDRVNWKLLDLALTHSSASPDKNYEQLEFVGDAVVRLASAKFLLETYGEAPVGDLAALRSVLVSDRVLADIAKVYRLDKYILMSASAAGDRAGFRSRQADALEAVMGALYLSTNDLSYVVPWLLPHLDPLAEQIRKDPAKQNYKAALQEWSQGKWKELPDYRVTEASVVHGDRERFIAEVWLQGCSWGKGKGPSIKAAQQAAAQAAFERAQAMWTERESR